MNLLRNCIRLAAGGAGAIPRIAPTAETISSGAPVSDPAFLSGRTDSRRVGDRRSGGDSRSSVRAFTMIEIAISLAVVAFALVAIIGVLPRGLNTQRDNRTETTINLDAQYWMDVLRNSAKGTNLLIDHVRSITYYDIPNDKVLAFYTNGPSSPTTFSSDREIVGLLLQPSDPNIRVWADVVALNGSAVEKTGPESEVSFAYRMYVMVMNASSKMDLSVTNAPIDLPYLEMALYNLRLEFAWALAGGRVGPHRQTYRSVAQGTLAQDPADSRLNFFTR